MLAAKTIEGGVSNEAATQQPYPRSLPASKPSRHHKADNAIPASQISLLVWQVVTVDMINGIQATKPPGRIIAYTKSAIATERQTYLMGNTRLVLHLTKSKTCACISLCSDEPVTVNYEIVAVASVYGSPVVIDVCY